MKTSAAEHPHGPTSYGGPRPARCKTILWKHDSARRIGPHRPFRQDPRAVTSYILYLGPGWPGRQRALIRVLCVPITPSPSIRPAGRMAPSWGKPPEADVWPRPEEFCVRPSRFCRGPEGAVAACHMN